MSFKRSPILELEIEDHLKQQFHSLWLSGMSGKNIAKTLKFGAKGSAYEKLQPCYVYFYRLKWQKLHLKNAKQNPLSFPPRRKPSFAMGERRYKVAPEDIEFISTKEFIELLDEKLYQESQYSRRARAFLITLFFTPLRSSEIFERTIDDFIITKNYIKINLLRKKKKHKPSDKSEPIKILRAFPLVDELVDYLQSDEWQNPENRPWNISHDTALNYVKEIMPEGYPHFFRFKFLTEGANDSRTSLAELKAKSRLTLTALERYIMAPEKLEDEFDRRKLERMKEEGLIK